MSNPDEPLLDVIDLDLDGGDAGAEVLALGRPSRRRWSRGPRRRVGLALAAAAAVLVGAVTWRVRSTDPGTPGIPAAAARAANVPVVVADSGPACSGDLVRYVDHQHPQLSLVITSRLPGYRVYEVSRTADQDSGHTCTVTLRAKTDSGLRLDLRAHAPSGRPPAEYAVVDEHSTAVVADLVTVTASGWTVDVELIGPPGYRPPTDVLRELSRDPRLTG